MPLAKGEKLGPYEILEAIGKGGMGEVYRAHDPRMGRDVAIKVSGEHFSERFSREVRAIAALNHPNVCHLYDVGPDFLVMELVEGPTLADRIKHGAIPLDESLAIARQIAEALEAAHEKGITHRDLKPGNIKITPEDTVKVLDFGLAKVSPRAAPGGDNPPDDSPTLTMAATQAGMILGTAAYMSPEQARGKSVNPRADIWAFGVVLYEMITGRRLFQGEDLTETLASVVKESPDLSAVPAQVRRLLESCLQKDPKKRLQAIGDWKLLLDSPQQPAPAVVVERKASLLWPAVAAVFALAATALAFVHFRETPPPANSMRVNIPVPADAFSFVALSPDGRRIALSILNDGAKGKLYLRSLDSTEFEALEGTDNARSPFWSPDSRFLAFFAEGQLKMVPASGGPTTTLCRDTGIGFNGTWSERSGILFATEQGKLRRVQPSGGNCSDVDLGSKTNRISTPIFLPDGNHFTFVGGDSGDPGSIGLRVASLDGMKPRTILRETASGLYAPPENGKGQGHLLFLRQNTLMAQTFDLSKLEVSGDPVRVLDQVSPSPTTPGMEVSLGPGGTLVYLTPRFSLGQLTILTASGGDGEKVEKPANLRGVSLSPDGNSAVANENFPDPRGGIRVFDLVHRTSRRFLTVDVPNGEGVWSPDGMRLIYAGTSGGKSTIFMRDVNGGDASPPLLAPSDENLVPSDMSRDGRFLIYTANDPQNRGDIWYLPDPGKPGSTPVKFLATPANESQGQLSPDGKWLAYSSADADSAEILVRSFPAGDRVLKVAQLAYEPRWSADGRQLFYAAIGKPPKFGLTAVAVQSDRDGLRFGTPKLVAEYEPLRIVAQLNMFSYAPFPDGKRFLILANAQSARRELNLITHWESLLK